MEKVSLKKWDALDRLNTDEERALYLNACIEEDPGDGSLIRAALGDIALAESRADVAVGRFIDESAEAHVARLLATDDAIEGGYKLALIDVSRLVDLDPDAGTPDGDRLSALVALVEAYESRMNQHIGSNFDDFLAEEGILEEIMAVAVKRVLAWQISTEALRQELPMNAVATYKPAVAGFFMDCASLMPTVVLR